MAQLSRHNFGRQIKLLSACCLKIFHPSCQKSKILQINAHKINLEVFGGMGAQNSKQGKQMSEESGDWEQTI